MTLLSQFLLQVDLLDEKYYDSMLKVVFQFGVVGWSYDNETLVTETGLDLS